jgi:hypothetical protein
VNAGKLHPPLINSSLFEIDQRQRVASAPRALPAKGNPNVVGTPSIVGTPVWVLRHVGVLGAVDTYGVEGGVNQRTPLLASGSLSA